MPTFKISWESSKRYHCSTVFGMLNLNFYSITTNFTYRVGIKQSMWGGGCGGYSFINTTGFEAQPLMSFWNSVTVNPKSYLECSLKIWWSEIKGQVPITKKDEILLTHWKRDRGGGRKDILIQKLDSTTAKMERGKPDLSWLFLDTGFYEIQTWDC